MELELEPENVATKNSANEDQAQKNTAENLSISNERLAQTESVGTMIGSADAEPIGTARSSSQTESFTSSIDRHAQTEPVETAISSHESRSQIDSVGTASSSQERHAQTEPVGSVRSSLERLIQTESTAAKNNSSERLVIRKNDQPQTEPVGSAKCSHERQLNLNKLFQEGNLPGGESNPMWETLMQLAAHMVENKDESREKPPKQYSIYLLVSSDDESDTETEARNTQEIQQLSDLMQQNNNNNNNNYAACIPGTLSYKMPENFSEPTDNFYQQLQQLPEVRRKKKRTQFRKRRDEDLNLNPSLPPRKPLHWPKPDFSKPLTKKTRKLLNSSYKFNWLSNPQPLPKRQYRWS